MTLIYFICVLAWCRAIVSLIQGFRSVSHIRTYRPQSDWRPRVVVFCPCRGVDAGFRENIRSILDQDYPHFRVVFIVDSATDPAVRVLSEAESDGSGRRRSDRSRAEGSQPDSRRRACGR